MWSVSYKICTAPLLYTDMQIDPVNLITYALSNDVQRLFETFNWLKFLYMGTDVREDKIKRREGSEDTLANDRNMGANKLQLYEVLYF